MAKADAEQTGSYGALERFLIWFLIPFVFTAVLLGVLLTIFDYNVMNTVLKTANKIPVVSTWVPDPKGEEAGTPVNQEEASSEDKAAEEAKAAADAALQSKEEELKQAQTALEEKDKAIKELESQKTAQEEAKAAASAEEEYEKQIQQLASTYAKMSPSKSAPIMENLTTAERVLVLSKMKTDDRVKVLEKMDPKIAAEASILLKDQVSVKDTQIAALQERVKALSTTQEKTTASDKLSKNDLGSTFSSMTPKSAAIVLMELQRTNPDKVLSILGSMDSAGRSKILSAISDQSKETAALISARLAQ
ncbi:MotE family protein [Paenibacillus sp. S-38]|uniref:MotE family protein n=1 Tax=Paenibacillus sp. S-38 TaxID=3416710 RepID=UPI003CF4A62B